MRHYIQFFYLSTGWPDYTPESVKPIEACGSEGVLLLDNRLSRENMLAKGREAATTGARAGKFVGMRLMAGPGERIFTGSRPASDYVSLV